MRDMLFNLAHWIFCYKYWIIAIEMQALLEAKPISQARRKCYSRINILILVLDVLSPLLYSLFYALVNTVYGQKELRPTKTVPGSVLVSYLVFFFSRGVLLIIAAGFLTDSIYRIRKAIYKVDNQQKLNQKSFFAHLFVLFLFILSTVIFYVAFAYL